MGKLKVGGWIIVGLLVLVLMSGAGLAWRYFTAPVKGIVDAEEQINQGSNRIQKYNHFFDLCSTIQSDKMTLETQRSLLESAEGDKERARVRANIAGIEAQMNRNANQYNVDARKEYTAARFKSSDLPYQIDTTQEYISCK